MLLFFDQNIQFLHPWFLALLLLIPAAGVWYYLNREKYSPTFKVSSLQAVEGISNWRTKLRPFLPILRALSFALLVIALARPQSMLQEQKINAEGIDIFLVMDLSSSMLSRDFQPDRLEASKKVATDFVDKRKYDRIGLSVFSGEAFTKTPLTTDHRIVKDAIGDLQCGILTDGTAIGMGLATAVNRMKDSKTESKVVILLTDGDNNAGYIKPETAAEIAKEIGIKIYTIGVGSLGVALTPVSKRFDGSYTFGYRQVNINEQLLQQIAKMTGGKYFRATNETNLEAVYNAIDQLEKTEIEVTTIKQYTEEFYPFAFLGLVLLLLEILLRYTVLRSIP